MLEMEWEWSMRPQSRFLQKKSQPSLPFPLPPLIFWFVSTKRHSRESRGGNKLAESSIWVLSTRRPSLLPSISTIATATTNQKSLHVAVEKL